jgi:hypothetical protein
MLDLVVHALLAYVICPALVYFAVRTMNKYSDIRSPKVWWAIASAIYGMLSVILGLVQGARTATDLGILAGWRDPWLAVVIGAVLSLVLCFWMLLVAENRFFARSSEIPE